MTEQELFERMRFLDQTGKLSYAEIGRICIDVQARMLHHERIDPDTGHPCTFTRWIRIAAPWGYSTCFAAYRDVHALSDVPAADLAQIPQANFHTLKQLSTAVRAEPSVLHAAKTKQSEEFIDQIKRDHPSQHIESRKTLRFFADESQAQEIEEAILQAMERGAMNRTEALVCLAVNYRADLLIEELQKETT